MIPPVLSVVYAYIHMYIHINKYTCISHVYTYIHIYSFVILQLSSGMDGVRGVMECV